MQNTAKSLAELNETRTHVRTWSKYTLECKFAVGSQSRRWTGSPKTHLLQIETVLADADPQPGTYKVGQIFSASAMCDSNGQHTGTAYPGQDTDSVTCERCLSWLGVKITRDPTTSSDAAAERRAAARAERIAAQEAKAAREAAKLAERKNCAGTDWNDRPCDGRASKTSDFCSVCRPHHPHAFTNMKADDRAFVQRNRDLFGPALDPSQKLCGLCGEFDSDPKHQ